ncbi:MAG: DUF4339 domain-containing protein [Bacteroidales bacterium]|nr:DUF4339 domain-containing protein [Bacteroidales bacterium]
MAANWHYATGGEKHGPVTASQLKELATTGKLSPDDLVWREDMTEWRKASTVKGLFPVQPTTATETPPHDAAGESVPLWERPVILVLLVTCCFPVGLFLLWRSPRIATKYKAIGTGAVVGLMMIGFLLPDAPKEQRTEPRQATQSKDSDAELGIYSTLALSVVETLKAEQYPDTNIDRFTNLMRQAAESLGPDKIPNLDKWRNIEPTKIERWEFEGKQAATVYYGPFVKVNFVLSRRTGDMNFILAYIERKEYGPRMMGF